MEDLQVFEDRVRELDSDAPLAAVEYSISPVLRSTMKAGVLLEIAPGTGLAAAASKACTQGQGGDVAKVPVKWGVWLGLLAAVSACASPAPTPGPDPGPGPGARQSLLAAWNTGSCPQNETDWSDWVRQLGSSANVGPILEASPGQHTTELPITVDRFVLCRYDTGSGKRTGTVVVTAPAIIARLTADLSDVIATDHTSCPGSQNLAMIAGEGQHVLTGLSYRERYDQHHEWCERPAARTDCVTFAHTASPRDQVALYLSLRHPFCIQ